jgi:hypothetical protein
LAGRASEVAPKAQAEAERRTSSSYQRETATERFVKNVASSVGRSVGSAIVRGILGGLLRR